MKVEPRAKMKSNKKMLAIAVIIIVVVAAVVSWQIYEQSSIAKKTKVILPTLDLKLVGANGQQMILNSSQLADLNSYTGSGGYSGEGKTYVGNFTGVPILALLDLVGGITSNENVTVTGSDGYNVTFTYQQVHCQGLNTYNPNTGTDVQPSQPMKMIIAYYCNGTVLTPDKGPLSAAFVGPQGLLTQGRYWAYFLVRIEIIKA